jgi:Zn-dependent protease
MTHSIRLGRIFGIEIGVNWSLILIFALITWTLAGTVLPQSVPNQSLTAYWTAAVFGALAFYGCLLAHELSHAVMARSRGVRVTGITLWLFGGVSRLGGEPRSAGAEALLTAVGPLTSFVVAGLAFGLSVIAAAAGAPALVQALLDWLAFLNVVLGVFNLVPAFPLDGGRLLSAFFWWRTGSRRQGVHRAVQVGRVFASLMIALGVFELFSGLLVNGIWIAFIGWFLLSAAGAAESATTTRAALRSVPVSAAMSSPVVTVPDWLMIEDFLQSAAAPYHFTTYPLHDPSGTLTGLVRLGELLRVPPRARVQQRLRNVATPISQVLTASPDEPLDRLIERVGGAFDRRVLVFDHGQWLVGIVSPSDVARLVLLRQAVGDRPLAA